MLEFEGVVLAQYPSSEHSAVVVVLTDEGKKNFYARGILKTTHPSSAACSVGSLSLFQCSKGKQGAYTLSHAHLKQTPLNRFHVSDDLFVYQWFIEFLGRIDMDTNEAWYLWFHQYASQFNTRSALLILADALYTGLDKLGIGITFSSCASCGRMEGIQDFVIAKGGLICSACIEHSKRITDLTWIKTMIDYFHYHRSELTISAAKQWIKLAFKHLEYELNIQLTSGSIILKIHS